MSLQWKWDEKVGEVILSRPFLNTEEHIYIYNGNALSIWVWEDHDQYQMHNFFVDEAHLKNCDNDFEWWNGIDHIIFYKWNKQNQTLAKYLAKRGVKFIVDTKLPFGG